MRAQDGWCLAILWQILAGDPLDAPVYFDSRYGAYYVMVSNYCCPQWWLLAAGCFFRFHHMSSVCLQDLNSRTSSSNRPTNLQRTAMQARTVCMAKVADAVALNAVANLVELGSEWQTLLGCSDATGLQ